jgi:hypothetical protein
MVDGRVAGDYDPPASPPLAILHHAVAHRPGEHVEAAAVASRTDDPAVPHGDPLDDGVGMTDEEAAPREESSVHDRQAAAVPARDDDAFVDRDLRRWVVCPAVDDDGVAGGGVVDRRLDIGERRLPRVVRGRRGTYR